MNLLLDEDSQGNVLVRLLRDAGHNVETVSGVDMAGQNDPAVFTFATRTRRVLLTRNGRDFLLLHQANTGHAGILVEHQDADAAKNMTYPQIAAAIAKIEASGWDLSGVLVSLNAWQ